MKFRNLVFFTALVSLVFIQCNKEEPIDFEGIAFTETVAGTSMMVESILTETIDEDVVITFSVDYPTPMNADLSDALLSDIEFSFDPALPSGTEIELTWDGEVSSTFLTTDGSGTYWMSQAFSLTRNMLEMETDHTISLTLMTAEAGTHSFTATAITAEAGNFDSAVDRTELATDDASFTVGDRMYDLAKIETSYGDILMWLYDETPKHKANFFAHILFNFYDGLIFHRVVDEFVIQGGDPAGTGSGGPGYTIDAEIGLPHVYGAVGAARLGDAVNPLRESSGSQFYIVDADAGASFLDGEYTVFGIVVDGMPAVEAISVVDVDMDDKPLTDVVMTDVVTVQYTEAQLLEEFGFSLP